MNRGNILRKANENRKDIPAQRSLFSRDRRRKTLRRMWSKEKKKQEEGQKQV